MTVMIEVLPDNDTAQALVFDDSPAVVEVYVEGPQGIPGAGGEAQGIPDGGSTSMLLQKASVTDYDAAWVPGFLLLDDGDPIPVGTPADTLIFRRA